MHNMHDQSPSRTRPARPLDTSFLRAFEAAARLGSFTAAARELSLSQSALSRQIQSLEHALGVELFVRDGPRARLNADGERLAATARHTLQQLDATVDELRAQRRRPRVRITTFASFASLWLMPRLPLFQAEHPDVDLAVEASDRIADLDGSGQDVALRLIRHDSALAHAPGSHALFEEHIAPVCSPRLLAELRRAGGLRSPADLARTTLIADVGTGHGRHQLATHVDALSWPGWFAAIGQRPVQPKSWLHLDFTHQAVQAALAGMGVAMGQMALIRQLLDDGSLVLPLGEARPSGYIYHLVRRVDAAPRAEVDALLRWLQAQLVGAATTP
ncbi:glycine cleavage system transcriptional activator [mine drainage metagenome]|jgi:DNA-binding transcriptional LysR family regulator|uniref:Glycine cleavage system transcriptional activator n=1 Tax=mine drainage metagenome TaxID=410659 RepID=A0A1J5RSG6_9ZZZZ